MANLEHLKKRAKLYLRWHRQGYDPVAVRIRSVLPRYGHLSDGAVLAQGFKLSDAQELVAREQGFASWEALKSGIGNLTAPPDPSDVTPILISAEPQPFVADIESSLDFYLRMLGFRRSFVYGDPPYYAQVYRDSVRLNLRQATGPVFEAGFRHRVRDALSAMITLDDAKPSFLEFQAAGVPFHQKLRSEPWGARTFIVSDPDGNLIGFAGRDD